MIVRNKPRLIVLCAGDLCQRSFSGKSAKKSRLGRRSITGIVDSRAGMEVRREGANITEGFARKKSFKKISKTKNRWSAPKRVVLA
jgi:hypothetical protein